MWNVDGWMVPFGPIVASLNKLTAISLMTDEQGRRNDFFLRGARFIRKTKFC